MVYTCCLSNVEYDMAFVEHKAEGLDGCVLEVPMAESDTTFGAVFGCPNEITKERDYIHYLCNELDNYLAQCWDFRRTSGDNSRELCNLKEANLTIRNYLLSHYKRNEMRKYFRPAGKWNPLDEFICEVPTMKSQNSKPDAHFKLRRFGNGMLGVQLADKCLIPCEAFVEFAGIPQPPRVLPRHVCPEENFGKPCPKHCTQCLKWMYKDLPLV